MKTAVITGASQGLGRVLALKLAQQQYQVLLIARSPELLSEVVAEITASGGRASHFVCDLTDLVQVTTTVQQIQKKSPQLEILINNAGSVEKVFAARGDKQWWESGVLIPYLNSADSAGTSLFAASITGGVKGVF